MTDTIERREIKKSSVSAYISLKGFFFVNEIGRKSSLGNLILVFLNSPKSAIYFRP
jgi:hypothetical protein